MADYETIMKALRAADAAGDTAAAQRLAQMAISARQDAAPQPAPTQEAPAALTPDGMRDRVAGMLDDYNQREAQAASWMNRAGESMTLGLVGDEAAAAADSLIGRGDGYDERLAHYRQQEEDLGTVGRLTADIGGALVPAFTGAGLLAQLPGWGGRALAGAGVGGVSSATYGFMEGEGDAANRRSAAGSQGLIGALIGGAIPVVGAGVRSVSQSRAARKAVREAASRAPSTEALRTQGNALYQQIDDAGVQISPQAFDDMRGGLLDRLRANTGFDELPGPGSLTPNSARVVGIMDEAGKRMAQEPTAALPFRSLDQMRRQAGAASGNVTNRADQRAGSEIIDALDDFVQRLTPDDVVGGDVKSLQTAIPKAREVWGRMSRSQMIDDAIEQSENYLGGGASGVRNQLAKILRSPKLSRGFTDAEKKALRSALRGGFVEQAVGLAGGGIGRIAQAATGAAMGGVSGAAAGLAGGQVARSASEAMAMRSIERARAAIASGALRDPGLLERLAIAGQRSERLTNTGLLGGLLAGQQATP